MRMCAMISKMLVQSKPIKSVNVPVVTNTDLPQYSWQTRAMQTTAVKHDAPTKGPYRYDGMMRRALLVQG